MYTGQLRQPDHLNNANFNIEDIPILFSNIPQLDIGGPASIIVEQELSSKSNLNVQNAIHQDNLVNEPETNNVIDKSDAKVSEQKKFIMMETIQKEYLTPVKLENVLIKPKTPQRKGVRQIERVSFVLTSDEWQSKELHKQREKSLKEEQIKKRKEDRLLKKSEERNKKETKGRYVLQSIQYARKHSLDPFIINNYFQLLGKTLHQLNLRHKPHLICNLDESSFYTDPSKTKVVGSKGIGASRTTAGVGRENITVLMAGNAAGHKAPPLIIFKGKNLWDEWTIPEDNSFPGTTYVVTSNGWVESEVFLNYFKNSFLKEIGDARPSLLIYDGHVSHVDERLISCALQNDVAILKLPPHSSHFLQPIDLSVH
ncbi:hypothetical protein MML48_4g00000632 [Holotrichia oblita]|uniref:Uncharacterized protein n=1 Tax=Holotrichia oblita TaxID=644536 RepID=A0ACB9T8Z5_HOLOL|nr:hypothetical protein MML48_4g00000632 [Holotrichia oblita]